MIQFQCDYNEGAPPMILQRLAETNMEQTIGYSEDPYCEQARNLIKHACQNENIDVHFLVGGTQTNTTVIAHTLRPYQGVLSAVSGHINVHETGAIEATGHKVLAIDSPDGKLTTTQIEQAMQAHLNEDGPEHMVQPGMVYLSFPTEVGTIYTLSELKSISMVCHKYRLPLFIDGARLGYGLCSPESDITLPELTQLADVFYIGGTKVGALFGEAVVINNPELNVRFRYMIKQKGGMLAKGRLLGVQFCALMENGLYFEIAAHAIRLADKLRAAFRKMGYSFFMENTTNQLFPILPGEIRRELAKNYTFIEMDRVDDDRCACRFCTSWATKEENVEALCAELKRLLS